jgi:hypothetical protein
MNYAVFLIIIALSLELVARYSHVRSEQMRIAGFRYLRQHDIMGVSNRPALETVASDYARRLVRYRALAHGAPGANYFSRNSTSLGVFRFADEVAQRLNIAELVSEKLL